MVQGAAPMVLHVTSSQDEFRQQQVDVLWRVGGARATQVCIAWSAENKLGCYTAAQHYGQM